MAWRKHAAAAMPEAWITTRSTTGMAHGAMPGSPQNNSPAIAPTKLSRFNLAPIAASCCRLPIDGRHLSAPCASG